jgi:hypothetical protein
MYKSLMEQGFMKDDPREEVTWPWPLHLQHARASVGASPSVEQVPDAAFVLCRLCSVPPLFCAAFVLCRVA